MQNILSFEECKKFVETEMLADFPTPDVVQHMIADEAINPCEMARLVMQTAYYAFHDISDQKRSLKAFKFLVQLCRQTQSTMTGAIDLATDIAAGKVVVKPSGISPAPAFGNN